MSMGVLDHLTEKTEAAYRAIALRVAAFEAVDETEIRESLGMTGRGVDDLRRDVEAIQNHHRLVAELRKADDLAAEKLGIEAKLAEARKVLEAVVAESRAKIAEAGRPVESLKVEFAEVAKRESYIRGQAETELHRLPVAPETAARLNLLRVEREAADHRAKDCRDAIAKAARWPPEFASACKFPGSRQITDAAFGGFWPEWHPRRGGPDTPNIPFGCILPPGGASADDPRQVEFAQCQANVKAAEQEAVDAVAWLDSQYGPILADIARRTVETRNMLYIPSGVTWSGVVA